MNAASVNVYNGGYDDFVIEDITPILSDASSYSQKWESTSIRAHIKRELNSKYPTLPLVKMREKLKDM